MGWNESVIDALTRLSLKYKTNSITRQQIIEEELERIVSESSSEGLTPSQTLSRVLQNLRDEGFLEFDGSGRYTLIASTLQPNSADLDESEITKPDRAPTTVHRIIRDTSIVSKLKRLYLYKCQICGIRLELSSGFYCEAHHLRPLGRPHKGPDHERNIVIVCPNHHVLLDYGAIKLDSNVLFVLRHEISQDFIEYHNNNIFRVTEPVAGD
jgi:predicted restriction endonuclease|tara:strand:+ start:962 stop:1594 length:633 start_codon:yes stop_codon:yes gene_type:complete